ncbi:MAG: hypothetical protein Ct9H90mP20_6300 [Candidatus Neomarinimicrobiota bacterium]|nr:MAG: hypothetical protein Ct9H90mP20_6300 [Candidatus Neomarinimicrobiota bacterium]
MCHKACSYQEIMKKNRLQDIDFNKATSSKSVDHGNPYASQSEETTHYSIVEKKGERSISNYHHKCGLGEME